MQWYRNNPPDTCDHDGAVKIAERIKAYWEARGLKVTVSIQRAQFVSTVRSARFDVRSDICDGLPTQTGIVHTAKAERKYPMGVGQ